MKARRTGFMIFLDLMGYSYVAKELDTSRQAVRSWAQGAVPNAPMVRKIVEKFKDVTFSDFYEYDS